MGYFINRGYPTKEDVSEALKNFLDLSAQDAEVIEYTNHKGEVIQPEPVKEPKKGRAYFFNPEGADLTFSIYDFLK